MQPARGRTLWDLAVDGQDRLQVQCDRCERLESFCLHLLIESHGKSRSIAEVLSDLSVDCPKTDAGSVLDPCGARLQGESR